MKNIINNKPQLVTKVIYLIPVLLIYTVGLCVAHVLSSESDVTLAHIGGNKLIDRPVHATPVPASSEKRYAAEEIEPFQDFLRRIARANAARIARADAARALDATRQSVFTELQENVSKSFYAFKQIQSNSKLLADRDANKSLAATRQSVLDELRDNISGSFYAFRPDSVDMQQLADNDGKKSLVATRLMVTAELKNNVNDLFHDQFQNPGDQEPDEKRLVRIDVYDRIVPYKAAYKIADTSP